MQDRKLILRAENFLAKHKIEFVKPGEIGERQKERIEVVFLVPLALEPNSTMDPPDVRVWVNLASGEVTLIDQM